MNGFIVWKVILFNESYRLEKVEIDPNAKSMDEITQQMPQGAYTTFRTFSSTKVLPMEGHFARLKESSELAGVPLDLNQHGLRQALSDALKRCCNGDVRIRVTIDLEVEPGTIYIAVEPLKTPPSEAYENGVKVVTCGIERTNPKAKLTNFIQKAGELRQNLPPGVNEALMMDQDEKILEGLSSNFFAVKNGELWTPGEGVLWGIIRGIVIKEAEVLHIPVNYGGISVWELDQIDEAFITSASRSVLPVSQINTQMIGDGKPGKITQTIGNRYWKKIEEVIEEL